MIIKYRITQEIGGIKTTTETERITTAFRIIKFTLELNPNAKLTIEQFKITEK